MRRRSLSLSILTATLVLVFLSTPALAGLLVSVDWLAGHKDDPNVVVVDVQNKPPSYAKGHIPGALRVVRHVDLEDPNRYPPNKYPGREQFLALMARLGISNQTTVVAYDDHHGIFASRFLFVMELYGHDTAKLKLLNGGIKAWQAAGRPLTTKPANARSAAAYTASGPNQNLLVSWSRVFRDVVQGQDPRVALHDARPKAEFKGDKIRAIRGGHIPGAINLTGVDAANHKNEQTFKPIDEIRAAFVKAGITPDKTVYTYCHSSDRAAHAYMVLKHLLGYPDVKVYEGAWKEWGNLTALPAANETLP
ncbi:MAG TPA: sulfurtransferase [Desulfobacterales bacterium]|nr:sulfurtransferase [Desulfobacterales bacterium]